MAKKQKQGEYAKLLSKLDEGVYKNSRELQVGGLKVSVRDMLVKAPLMAGLNLYLVGATGEGKTQLAHDLASYFGNSFCYAMGRNDFDPKELLEQVNLSKLKEVKTDKDLVQLTENVQKQLFYVDELNRCPAIVQNYFFDFFDGKIVHKGRIVPLGKDGYSVGFASGNLGDGDYIGTSDSDRALKDRMHMIVKLDYPDFSPTELDEYEIFASKKDPRASVPDKSSGCLSDIIKLHNELKKREEPAILHLLGLYFTKGLDYLSNTKKHSKRAVDAKWPRLEGIKDDQDEASISPLSKRAVIAAISLTQAVEMIAEQKGQELKNSVPVFLDCLRFTVPYSGVIHRDFIINQHEGDAYSAFDAIMKRNKEQIMKKLPNLEMALLLAEAGKKDANLLSKIAGKEEGKWLPIRNALEMRANAMEKNPAITEDQLNDILNKAKSGR